MEDPRRACQRHLRMDRVLVQPETTPFQSWYAQPDRVREAPHPVRSQPLTPNLGCPGYGGSSVAVRWYLRYGLSYRDVEELLAERGIDVDHVRDTDAGTPSRRTRTPKSE